MCQTSEHMHPTPTGEDEWVLDTPRMREFVEAVHVVRHSSSDPKEILAGIRPHFTRLLNEEGWLPEQYCQRGEDSGMGGSIGMWLLYRAGDGSLAFSVLVVPPGQQTPVHDHLAWGLVGLYRGAQDEDVFSREDQGEVEGRAVLSLTEAHPLLPGDMYELLPENDIHRVRTTSEETSVSLHLLGIDNGCIVRHRFFPEEEKVIDFVSGYVNSPCPEEIMAAVRS